jgi:hypothetical protein
VSFVNWQRQQASAKQAHWLAAQLRHLGHLDKATYKTLMTLMKLRNEAVHLSDREIPPADSAMMAQLCIPVRAPLKARTAHVQATSSGEK